MRLARALGCTLEELNERMSGSEFDLWWAEYQREPWGEERADLRTAMATYWNVRMAGKSLKENSTVNMDWFLLKFGREIEPSEEVSPAQFFRSLRCSA